MTELVTLRNIENLDCRVYQLNGEEIPFYIDNGTLYGSQKSISKALGVSVPTISNYYSKLAKLNGFNKADKTVRFSTTNKHNRSKTGIQSSVVTFYPLDIIIAIGEMKNPALCKLFSDWANSFNNNELNEESLTVETKKYESLDISTCKPEIYAFGED